MATPCILYPERTNILSIPAEPWHNFRRTAAKTTYIPNNPRATHQDLTDVPPDVPTEDVLRLEIDKLCTATLTIDEAFYDIGRKLSDASKEQKEHTDLYDTCCALETQWNEHQQTYKKLLWHSREFAGEAQGVVDDFREMVLPALRDPVRPRSEKQEIIQAQIKVIQDTSQPSQKLCQDFLDFARALDTYIAEFSRVVEGLEIDEQRTKVSGLEDRMRSARDSMEAVSQEVKELLWKFVSDIAMAGIALFLAFITPALWVKLPDAATFGIDYMNFKRSGPQLLEARSRCSSATRDYKAIKAKYDLEKTCLGQMVKLESTLHDSRPLVQEVTVKLGIFASVWAIITADIRKLKSSLHHADDPTSPLFILRVQRLERMYGYLSQALRHYQVTVRMPQ